MKGKKLRPPVLDIHSHLEHDIAIVRISDNGPGIDPELRDRIASFEPVVNVTYQGSPTNRAPPLWFALPMIGCFGPAAHQRRSGRSNASSGSPCYQGSILESCRKQRTGHHLCGWRLGEHPAT